MLRFLGRRIFFMVLSVWGLATAVFVMIKIIPGDEASVAAGESATPEMIEATRERLGLDQPLPLQYVSFLARLVRGDLGTSIITHQPITANLADVLPATIELVVSALLLMVVIAVPLGIIMAANRGNAIDFIGRVAAVVVAGMPIFWVAFMIQFLVAGSRALPTSGSISIAYSVPHVTGFVTIDSLLAGNGAAFADVIAHLVLPAIVLAAPQAAVIVRTLRASLLGELEEDYALLATSKGASRSRTLLRHALQNAAIPTVTTIGLQVGFMIAGSVLVESVFSRPGIGSYLSSAVTQKDTFAVLGSVIFIGAVVILVNFIVDLVHMAIDPRVKRDTLGAAA